MSKKPRRQYIVPASKKNRRPRGRRIDDQDGAIANAVGRLLFRTMDTIVPGLGLADAFEQTIKPDAPTPPAPAAAAQPEVINLRRNKDGVYE